MKSTPKGGAFLSLWSGREDSNLRPLGPKPSALPGCATPRTFSQASGLFRLSESGHSSHRQKERSSFRNSLAARKAFAR